MKFDLSQFKKVHEDQKEATLEHPGGHRIVISKRGLNKKLRQQLSSIPIHNLAEGGFSDDGSIDQYLSQNQTTLEPPQPMQDRSPASQPMATTSSQPAALQPQQAQPIKLGDIFNKYSAIPTTFRPEEPSTRPVIAMAAPTNPIIGTRAPQSSPPPPDSKYFNMMAQGNKEQMDAVNQTARAQADIANNKASLYGGQSVDLQKLHSQYQPIYNGLNQELASNIQDLKSGHIDPNHYWNDKTTGGKVASAIGLILGGIGGGLLGQENPALRFLNAQIDRDIESQKADLGRKESVYSANLKMLGNAQDAENMSRAFYKDLYANKIEEAMTKSQSPIALAAGKSAIGQLKFERAPMLEQTALRQSAMRSLSQGNLTPAQRIRLTVPEKEQGAALKELQSAQNAQTQGKSIMGAFDNANQENTVSNRIQHLGFEPASVPALQNLLMPLLKDSEGRINESELQRMDSLIPRPGDSSHKIDTKRKALQDFIKERSSRPILDAYGIPSPEIEAPMPNANVTSSYGKR